MTRKGIFILLLCAVLLVAGCGPALTYYVCHRIDPVHGCDNPKPKKTDPAK